MAVAHHQLQTELYDAAIVPELWTEMLDRLVANSGAKTGLLLSSHHDPLQVYTATFLSSRLLVDNHPAIYAERYRNYEAAAREVILRSDRHQIVTDFDIWPDKQAFDARPDVAYLREHFGVYRRIAARLNTHSAWYDALSVQYDEKIISLDDELLAPFRSYLPFVAQASELSKTFHVLKQRFRAVLAALDHYKVPVILLTPSGHVVLCNSAADIILSKADGLSLNTERLLHVAVADERAHLQDLIARTAATARGEGDTASGGLLITRPSGADPFYVEVSPLRDSDREVDARYQGAMLTVYDPDYAPMLDLKGFSAVHGLTTAEQVVTSLIVDGANTDEIAERRNTSLETVRNQVKSILRKTSSRSRTELVRRAVTSTIPVEQQISKPAQPATDP